MDKPLSILMVEDVPTEQELALRALKRAGIEATIERVETEPAFRHGLSLPPDIILSDFSLPVFDGMAALRIARSETPDIPFIFVSGTIGEERAIEALKHGAMDYVLKTNLARLGPAVRRALEQAQERRSARRAEQRFRDLIQTSQDWIWELDVDGRYVFSSPGVSGILGLEAEEIFGSHHTAHVHPDDELVVDGALRSLRADDHRSAQLTARFRHRDGSYRWLERHALALVDHQGLITGFRGADRDVTVRRSQEEKIARLNRIHIVLSSVNSAILRIRDRRELIEEVCRIAVRQGGYPQANVIFAASGQTSTRPFASEGDHAQGILAVDVEIHGTSNDYVSLTDRAVRTCAPAASNDLSSNETIVASRERLLAWGFRAAASLPLVIDGTAIGTFNLASRELNAFSEDELGVLGQVAGSLSFALQYLEKEGAASFLTYFDPMTGLARRSLLSQRLDRVLAERTSPGSDAVVVFTVDIERLGALNDRYGRHRGDRLLQLVAERLKSAVQNSTHLAYFGNGCFAGIETGRSSANASGARIAVRLGHLFDQPLVVDGQEILVSVRIGAARSPADGAAADALLQHAEMALKSAKQSGDKFVQYAPDMNRSVQRRMTLEQQLRRAHDERQFVLYYQPKVSVESGRIEGAEGLLRWNDPTSGLRSPAEFIPALEESGLILDVGQWVIAQAVSDSLAWQEHGLPAIPIAVNVSSRQLKPAGFVGSVLRTIAPLTPAGLKIELEITESTLMADIEASADKLKLLKAAGVGIAIDDFGTGYSSLGRLASLAVDCLKIDRSFVSKLDSIAANRAIVSTVISLARSFNLTVVAEGVETPSELDWLGRLKCQQFQGYLAGKPMPRAAFESLVIDSHGVLQTARMG